MNDIKVIIQRNGRCNERVPCHFWNQVMPVFSGKFKPFLVRGYQLRCFRSLFLVYEQFKFFRPYIRNKVRTNFHEFYPVQMLTELKIMIIDQNITGIHQSESVLVLITISFGNNKYHLDTMLY